MACRHHLNHVFEVVFTVLHVCATVADDYHVFACSFDQTQCGMRGQSAVLNYTENFIRLKSKGSLSVHVGKSGKYIGPVCIHFYEKAFKKCKLNVYTTSEGSKQTKEIVWTRVLNESQTWRRRQIKAILRESTVIWELQDLDPGGTTGVKLAIDNIKIVATECPVEFMYDFENMTNVHQNYSYMYGSLEAHNRSAEKNQSGNFFL